MIDSDWSLNSHFHEENLTNHVDAYTCICKHLHVLKKLISVFIPPKTKNDHSIISGFGIIDFHKIKYEGISVCWLMIIKHIQD